MHRLCARRTLSIHPARSVRYPAVTLIWLLSVHSAMLEEARFSRFQCISRTIQTLLVASATERRKRESKPTSSESKRESKRESKSESTRDALLVLSGHITVVPAAYRCVAHKFYAIITLLKCLANSRANARRCPEMLSGFCLFWPFRCQAGWRAGRLGCNLIIRCP